MHLKFTFVVLFLGYLFGSDHEVLASDNSTSVEPEQDVEAAANSLFEEYWQMELMDQPEKATSLGYHQYDDKLTSYSLKCYEKRKVMATEFLERANQLLPLAPEASETMNNIQLFILRLQYDINQLMSGSHLFPVSSLYTPEMGLRYLLKYTVLNDTKSYWNLIARYRAFPQQIEEIIDLMKEGIRTNYTLHSVSLWTSESKENQTVEESPFYKPFRNISSSISTDEAELIQVNASDAISNYIKPALDNMNDYINNEYRLHTRSHYGVGSLPNGQDFYHQELHYHLTDDSVTAEEIHAIGISEVMRIAGEMEEVIRILGLNMSRQEFSNQIRTDESQFFQSEEEVLETYRSTIADIIEPKLPLLFKYIPQKALTVEKIPRDISSGPRAYYMRAKPDNTTPATFFLDTSSLKNLPRYEVMTLAMHEGVPGHHFQTSYAMEQTGIPEFRKYETTGNAFIEGWALYAEYLGYEMGLYEDPYQRYGHLSEEMFRACRMVVDTGLHVLGWDRQQAIDYMLEYSAATLNNIEREVDRYITWPGQACAYKYGELKIKELRSRAESSLGADFDIKEFHDVVLRNSGPLELLEKQVDRYISLTSNSTFSSER